MTHVVVTRWYRSPELLFGAKSYGVSNQAPEQFLVFNQHPELRLEQTSGQWDASSQSSCSESHSWLVTLILISSQRFSRLLHFLNIRLNHLKFFEMTMKPIIRHWELPLRRAGPVSLLSPTSSSSNTSQAHLSGEFQRLDFFDDLIFFWKVTTDPDDLSAFQGHFHSCRGRPVGSDEQSLHPLSPQEM